MQISVDLASRLITLGGSVPSFHLRQVFCHLCRQLAPGFRVDDQLDVAPHLAPQGRPAFSGSADI
ncbi:MAG TPA: hypothetical protein VFB96_14365 [Pirellulaceae bacterium]|nr:hypothetical protein [Pirellulaceae bacterium]